MKLRREHSCIRGLVFAVEPSTPAFAARVVDALERLGWRPAGPALGELRTFVGEADGTTVLCVPSTGRVQLRVAYTVPETERRWAAERTFVELVRAVRGDPSDHPPGPAG